MRPPKRPTKRKKIKATPPGVRPLKQKPPGAGRYDYGFRPPKERNPWQDEGRPEASG